MKTTLSNKFLISIILLICINSCKEKDVQVISTKIFADGSCLRSYKTKYRKNVNFCNYPIPIDSTWDVKLQIDTTISEDDSVKEQIDTLLLYSKKFETVDALNQLYNDTCNLYAPVNRHIVLCKKFRWFYSLYEFKEIYKKLFTGKPIGEVFTENEMAYYKGNSEDSIIFKDLDSIQIKRFKDTVDTKYVLWLQETIYNNMFDAIIREVENNENLKHLKPRLIESKESIFNKVKFLEDDILNIVYYADSLGGADSALTSWINKDSVLLDFKKKIQLWDNIWFDKKLNYELSLPGSLLNNNADSVKNNILYYQVNNDKFFTENFEMMAVTKIKHTWSYYVTGIIFLILIILIVVRLNNKN